MEPTMPPRIDTLLALPTEPLFAGRYAIIRSIGVGGMGKVYEAYDTSIGRAVALKLMRTQAQANWTMVRRFHREYRAMARINHPGVPRVYDTGVDRTGRAYFTMELIHGGPLSTALSGPVTPARALAMVREVASILLAVHAAGVIHRDIKPDNILLDQDAHLHLIDFGACRLIDGEVEEGVAQPGEAILTTPGGWLGTRGYVDPVTMAGEPCSVRSDLFSLTATLHWLLTHQHPDLQQSVRSESLGFPELDLLLTRGMAPVPADRPASAGDFLGHLGALEAALGRAKATSPRPAAVSRFSPSCLLVLGALGGMLSVPLHKSDIRTDSTQVIEIANNLPHSGASPPRCTLTGSPRPSEVLGAPEAGPSASPATPSLAVQKNKEAAAVPPISNTTLNTALDATRDPIRRCVAGTRFAASTIEVSAIVDGPRGRLRRLKLRGISRRAASCVMRALRAVRFKPFGGTLDWTLSFDLGDR